MRPTWSSGTFRYTSGAAPEVAALAREVVLVVLLRAANVVEGAVCPCAVETKQNAIARSTKSSQVARIAMTAVVRRTTERMCTSSSSLKTGRKSVLKWSRKCEDTYVLTLIIQVVETRVLDLDPTKYIAVFSSRLTSMSHQYWALISLDEQLGS